MQRCQKLFRIFHEICNGFQDKGKTDFYLIIRMYEQINMPQLKTSNKQKTSPKTKQQIEYLDYVNLMS